MIFSAGKEGVAGSPECGIRPPSDTYSVGQVLSVTDEIVRGEPQSLDSATNNPTLPGVFPNASRRVASGDVLATEFYGSHLLRVLRE